MFCQIQQVFLYFVPCHLWQSASCTLSPAREDIVIPLCDLF